MSAVGRGRYDQKSQTYGSVPERPKGADCKSAGIAYVGSNPARPTTKRPIAIAIGRLCFLVSVLGVRQKLASTEVQSTNDNRFWITGPGESGDISEVTNA